MDDVIDFNAARKRIAGNRDTGRCPCGFPRVLCLDKDRDDPRTHSRLPGAGVPTAPPNSAAGCAGEPPT